MYNGSFRREVGVQTVNVGAAVEYVTISNEFGTITALEEAVFIECLVGQSWIVRNVPKSSFSTLYFADLLSIIHTV